MQHLYILHWIGETLLKEILHNRKTMGVNIQEYPKQFKTGTNVQNIQKSVKIRNNIAHNGLIWNPEEITFAIDTYRVYIEKIAKEQKVNLKKYRLAKHDQKFTKEDIKKKHQKFFSNSLQIERDELEKLDPKYSKYVQRVLEDKNWELDTESRGEMVKKVKHLKQNDFFVTSFGYDSQEIIKKLIAYEKNHNAKFDESDNEQVSLLTKSLFWLYYNQDHRNTQKVKKQILKKIEGSI